MRTFIQTVFASLLLAVCVTTASVGTAAAAEGTVRFKAGTLTLPDYLEMVSETLGWQVSAAGEFKTDLVFVVDDRGPLSVDQAAARVHSDLAIRGLSLVYDERNDLHRLLLNRDARDESIPLVTDAAQLRGDDQLITLAVPLKEVSSEFIARNLRSFGPANSRLVPVEAPNLLLITDLQRSMFKYLELIRRLDTPKSAEDSRKLLQERAKLEEQECPADAFTSSWAWPNLLLALIGLIGITLGFIVRGYVIRRIEGGL